MQKLLKLSSRFIATTTEYAFPTQIEQILFSVQPIPTYGGMRQSRLCRNDLTHGNWRLYQINSGIIILRYRTKYDTFWLKNCHILISQCPSATSMYSLTFRVRVTTPPQNGRNETVHAARASILSPARGVFAGMRSVRVRHACGMRWAWRITAGLCHAFP